MVEAGEVIDPWLFIQIIILLGAATSCVLIVIAMINEGRSELEFIRRNCSYPTKKDSKGDN